MNNIYAEADEILRTSNKKQIVSIILSMQGNYLRAREAEDRLAEAQELIKKLRRCANCKHKIEYALFGEVATACTLDVNEEENQTCKNFETPRTDRAAFTANFGGTVVVDADFARQLEIELAEAKAKLKDLGAK